MLRRSLSCPVVVHHLAGLRLLQDIAVHSTSVTARSAKAAKACKDTGVLRMASRDVERCRSAKVMYCYASERVYSLTGPQGPS